MKKVYIYLFLLLLSVNVYSQKEYYNWLFGNEAGISFVKDFNKPEIFLSSKMVSLEGSASISDDKGNLLFYTNGKTVWNRNHDTMPNGRDLLGHFSSPQSALILKSLNLKNIYYIFTVDAQERKPLNGLCYSIVDINLDNGYGDVTSKKNIQLNKDCSEKLTAIRNIKQDGYWIISHHNTKNQFFAFQLTKSGIKDTIISEIGQPNIISDPGFPYNTGFLKFSPNGEKLASSSIGNNIIELFDFNRQTGVFSNGIVIYDFKYTFQELNDMDSTESENTKPYGLEFSPNNSYLFATFNKGIIQFDINNMKNINNIYKKPYISFIKNFKNNLGGLQLGPDNKIYISLFHENNIGVIKNPNLNKFNDNDFERINLVSGHCNLALTNIINPLKENPKLKFTVVNNDFCDGDSAILFANLDVPLNYKYSWSNGDSSNYIYIKNSGFYSVLVKVANEVYAYDSIYITKREKPNFKIKFNGTNSICDGDELILRADPYDPKCSYSWSNGDSTSSIIVKKQGWYKLKATNNYGCWDTSSIYVDVKAKPIASIESKNKTSFCRGESITLNALPEGSDYSYEWSNGANTRSITVNASGDYQVKVKNKLGCYDSATIKITETKRPIFTILSDGDNQICLGFNEELAASSNDKSLTYIWSTGEKSEKITISKPGKYIVTAVDTNGCVSVDSIIIFKREIYLDYASEIDFGRICVGGSLKQILTINNKNSMDIRIKEIFIKNNSSGFIISNFSDKMQSLSKQSIDIQFNADLIKNYNDTLIIKVTEPCNEEFYIPIKAESYAIVKIFAVDTVALIDKNFGIPIYATIMCGNTIVDTLNGRISLNKTLLEPYANQDPGLTFKGIQNNLLICDIKKLINFSYGDTILLGILKGKIFLADENIIETKLSNFTFYNNLIEVILINGYIEIKGLCAKDLSRIKIVKDYYTISPNPASDFIEISLDSPSIKRGQGGVSLEIFNIFGESVARTSPSVQMRSSDPTLALPVGEGTVRIDISNLAAGVYFIKIGDKFEKFVKL
jgi:hypothetical protein